MKKFFGVIVLLGIVAGAYFCLEKLRDQKEEVQKAEIIRPVKTVKLISNGYGGVWHYYGTLQGGKRVELSFRVSGPIKSIEVDKGESVKKGQLLATLDPRDYRTNLRQAQSAEAQARAQYENAKADFVRYENLRKQKAISQSTYEAYKTQMNVAKSALNAATASTRAVRDSLQDTELRAPFDGVIVDRNAENFQDVTAKQTIFSLQDHSTLEIVFNVPDNDIIWASRTAMQNNPDSYKLKDDPDISLRAIFDAIPDKVFPLKLKEAVLQADSSTNTFPITAVMSQQEGITFLPGMSATVEVELKGKDVEQSPFIVPETALINSGTQNENFVWRYENNAVHKVPVVTGFPHNNGSIEISGNSLKDGDYIVVAGAHLLKEGQKVRLMSESK